MNSSAMSLADSRHLAMQTASFFAIRTSDNEGPGGLDKALEIEFRKEFLCAHKKNLKPEEFHADKTL